MTLAVSAEVAGALAARRAVVALETTLICHGIPRPDNLALALAMEREVRAAGATPATIGILDGQVKVGLDERELARLATADPVTKCSTRDLPLALATGGLGATTVAATVFLAARLGIKVMATGGLGGVHRGGERSLDVSADLEELARQPVVVVCSGIKSILDQARTLERLESLGIPVVGHRCAELPGFYTAQSGVAIARIDDLAGLRRLVRSRDALQLTAAIVVVQPPPAAYALPASVVEELVERAREAAESAGMHGPGQTPFMLHHMARNSAGATVRVNQELALANARLAAELAGALSDDASPEAAPGLKRT